MSDDTWSRYCDALHTQRELLDSRRMRRAKVSFHPGKSMFLPAPKDPAPVSGSPGRGPESGAHPGDTIMELGIDLVRVGVDTLEGVG